MIRYASVCDGIGAIHVASQRLGWQCVWTSEIARFPARVVDHHYQFRNLRDMTRFRDWPEKLLVDVDVLVGGTPCQAFSVAGKRRGLDDERGNLTLTFVNLFSRINEVRKNHGRPPAIALWENVPGVLGMPDNAFGCLLGGLLGCDEAPRTETGKWDKAGFLSSETARVGWRVLDAQYYALAQRRRRVFLIAVPCELVERFGEGACPSQILSFSQIMCRHPPTGRAGGKKTARSAGGRLAGQVARAGSDCIGFHANAQGCQLPSRARDTGIAETLTDSQRAAVAFTKSRRARSVDDYETWVPGDVSPTMNCFDQGDTRATTVVLQDIDGRGKKQKSKGWKADGTSFALTTKANQGVAMPRSVRPTTPVVSESPRVDKASGDGAGVEKRDVFALDGLNKSTSTEVHQTLRTGRDSGDAVAVNAEDDEPSWVLRRLTPREAERLMGYPDDYTLVPDHRGKPAADGPRYKALGNSMAVPIMRHICGRITKAIDGTGNG